jgi:hypothetical protein
MFRKKNQRKIKAPELKERRGGASTAEESDNVIELGSFATLFCFLCIVGLGSVLAIVNFIRQEPDCVQNFSFLRAVSPKRT